MESVQLGPRLGVVGPICGGGAGDVASSFDGRSCYISWSGTDEIARVSYRTGRVIDEKRVVDHQQRIRNGCVARDLLA